MCWKSILLFCVKVAWLLQARVGHFILTDIISINKVPNAREQVFLVGLGLGSGKRDTHFKVLQEGGPLPGPETGLLSNTLK